MEKYTAVNEQKKIKLRLIKEVATGYYTLETGPIDSDRATSFATYYRLEDLFSFAHKKYGVSKEDWKKLPIEEVDK
jgi:hypothetical protein